MLFPSDRQVALRHQGPRRIEEIVPAREKYDRAYVSLWRLCRAVKGNVYIKNSEMGFR